MAKAATSNSKKLTEAELNDLKDKANVILAFCRQQMLNRHPFIGNVAMNLDLKPTRDVRNPTACTDGNTIFFNIAFLAELNQEEREFVIGHEVWHNVMMHFARRDCRNPQIFNLATDMEVNQILEKDGFIAPKDLVWPNSSNGHKSQFDFPTDLSAEEYYELLLKKIENQQGDGDGEGEGGQGGEAADGQSSSSGSKKGSKKGSSLKGQFDKHLDPNEKPEADGATTDKYGEVGEDPDFNPKSNLNDAEKKALVEKIREQVVSAAQQVERSRGELPGYIKKIVDDLLKPHVPWRELLAAFVTSTIANKTDWNRPNRRFAYNGTYLPSHNGESLKIAVGVDTSGSCVEDFPKFMTELVSIAQTFGAYELHMIQCDTEVQEYTLYDEANPLTEDVAKTVEFKGCGGTVLKPVFDYIELNEIDADAIVFFTDGYCETFNEDDAPSIPTLWCITGCKDDNVSEQFSNLGFGDKIAIDAEK